ncbi:MULTISPECIES: N-acetyltransferase [Paenibacillus]|uniref:GNAT family N-acetyltransferase n=1 Tax=Paenibacillus TaxID=44249 RepID=UPI0004F8113B|nr:MULTISPECIES: GNAT family N-acetyltransferase [unclassified Paenibacillus]AIQ32984.1 hypothetical protein P40081_36415 [Paenibacillus sp. FSL P4-0081]OMF28805.1 hypothetical protein BK132_12580 [Paenibacillus sp. FSL H8-0259]
MNIEIINPEEDQYGNCRENIFIAFGEHGDYLGSAFTYPAINHHQTPDTPYLIYISVNPADHLAESQNNEVSQRLFDGVLTRAKELRRLRPDLTARIYAGFEPDQEKLRFYMGNGLEANYSVVMEASIQDGFTYTLPEDIEVTPVNLNSDQELTEYKERYDEIFVTPLNLDALAEQGSSPHFHNLSFLKEGKLLGGCTFFAKDGCGHIETVYVSPDVRGTGIAKVILNYIFRYFLAYDLNIARLEVWELNTRAAGLYRSLGFTEVEQRTMFPGFTL